MEKRTGKDYLLVMGLSLFSWLILGTAVTVTLISVPLFQSGLGELLDHFVPYILFFLTVLVSARFLLHTSLLKLLNSKEIRWKYAQECFVLYFVGITLFTFLTSPTIVPSGYSWKEILLFLPFALVLLLMQTLSEELFFRVLPCRMVYGEETEMDWRTLPLILSSAVLFLLPHLGNPEVLSSGTALFSILFYFLWGVFSMALGLYAHGFEGIFAAHAANNLFVALLVNYQNSALPSRPLFLDTGETSSIKSLILILILFTLLWGLTYIENRRTKKEQS
ncbi:MAG: CPBP family intramembrane metalloprotease [Spirochaetales bacterium]|nr:CPBP family intramembrane metalloprotease [Candidatus Physcosoma equi]